MRHETMRHETMRHETMSHEIMRHEAMRHEIMRHEMMNPPMERYLMTRYRCPGQFKSRTSSGTAVSSSAMKYPIFIAKIFQLSINLSRIPVVKFPLGDMNNSKHRAKKWDRPPLIF